MSTSNDGVSRFVASTVYAPTTFAAGIVSAGVTSGSMVCNTIDAEAVKMTLNSDVGLFLSGALGLQDVGDAGCPAAMVLENIAFNQCVRLTAARAFVLPTPAGGVGVPQGVRMSFFIDAAVAVTFITTAASLATIKLLRNTDAGIAFNNYAANAVTANLGQNTFVTLTSCDTCWVINSNSN